MSISGGSGSAIHVISGCWHYSDVTSLVELESSWGPTLGFLAWLIVRAAAIALTSTMRPCSQSARWRKFSMLARCSSTKSSEQMILAFIQVRNLLVERRDKLETNNDCSLVLKELYRQTIAAIAVLESCCCCRVHRFPQKSETELSGSWLEVAVTQSRMVFRVILDDLNWCSRLVARAGVPSQTTEEEPRCDPYNSSLTDMDHGAIETDMRTFEERLRNLGSVQKRDRLLAKFLRERLSAPLSSNDSEDADGCLWKFLRERLPAPLGSNDSDCLWKRPPSDHSSDHDVCETSWLGVRVVRKVFWDRTLYETEKKIMESLDHPNVVRFITASSKKVAAILMERVDTTLEDHLKQHPCLTMLEKVDIMYQTASVVAYLHENGVAHCDIKPANLLVNPWKVTGLEGYVHLKIADFGLSESGLEGDTRRNSSLTDCGTTIYRAPEMKGNPVNVNFMKADVFSFAMTCWQILHGKLPLEDIRRGELQEALMMGIRPEFDSDPRVPLRLQELIKRCWATEPENRPTFSEISMSLKVVKEKLLGVGVDEPISGLEIKTIRKRKVLQSAYDTVKAVAVQIRPPHVRIGLATQEEEYVFPGPDHEIPATNDIEDREPEQSAPAPSNIEDTEAENSTPAPSRFKSWKLRVRGRFSRREEDFIFPGPD